MTRRVVIAYSNLDVGGIPTKIIDIINAAVPKDIEFDVLLQKGSPDDFRTRIHNPRARIHDMPYRAVWGRQMLYIFWLWAFLLVSGTETVLAFISPYALPALAAKVLFPWKRFRVLVSEDHYTDTMVDAMALPWLQRLGIRLLYPRADVIIVPTLAVKTQLVSLCRLPRETIVVPNWSRYAGQPIPKMKRKYDILYAGRLVRMKNPQKIIQIMARHVRRHPTSHCAIVGEGPERKRLERYILLHDLSQHIEILPPSKDISTFLYRAKIFLFLPEKNSEGFPIALLDAMACGAVVVTTAFVGAEEIIHAKTGVMVTRINIANQAITEVLQNKATLMEMRLSAKQYAKKMFTIHNTEAYIRQSIVTRHASSPSVNEEGI